MARVRPCLVCGNMTSKSLFNARSLDIPICSARCEHQYVNAIDPSQEGPLLRYLDGKINATKGYKKNCWTIAGVGIVLLVVGLIIVNVLVFLAGAVSATFASFSLRYFEDRLEKLTKKRKRINI
jgi:hypothetical protein